MIEHSDEYYMGMAIALGEKATLISPPNPWVGAILVKNNKIVGRGYTSEPGRNHAEINALNEAKSEAENATLYVTLEPCSHYGRTPPCVDALIRAKIGRVVIALTDPDINVSGNGMKKLEEAGIPYSSGVCEAQARESLKPYLHQRSTGKPFVIAKSAISIDGRTAAKDGSSKWISCEEARKDAHYLRAYAQAILIGSGTALQDIPTLNVRGIDSHKPINQPLRVLFDARGIVPATGPLFDITIAKTLVFTSKQSNPETLKNWKAKGVEVEIIETTEDGKLNLEQALKILGEKGILQLLVEGGSTLLGSFLEKKAINKLIIYLSPKILGDQGHPLFKNFNVDSIVQAPHLKLLNIKQLGNTLRLDYETI